MERRLTETSSTMNSPLLAIKMRNKMHAAIEYKLAIILCMSCVRIFKIFSKNRQIMYIHYKFASDRVSVICVQYKYINYKILEYSRNVDILDKWTTRE